MFCISFVFLFWCHPLFANTVMPAGKNLVHFMRFVIIRLGYIVTKHNNSLYFELNERAKKCAAKKCECPAGRKYCAAEGQYAMIYCQLCGSEPRHKRCNGRPYFRCNTCTGVKDRNDNDCTSVSRLDFNQDDCTDDENVSSEDDDEQVDTATVSDCTDSDNSIMDPSDDEIACSVHMRPGKIRLRLASSSSSNDLDIVYHAVGKRIRMTIL